MLTFITTMLLFDCRLDALNYEDLQKGFFLQLLEQISFIDTPGILSGEKQRINRNYDFTGVTEWFAAKCNLILLFFDPHKLDISDELKRVILSLRGHEDKIRIVLNRVDQVNTFQVTRKTVSISLSCEISTESLFPVPGCKNLFLLFSTVDEGLWSSNVVSRQSFENTRGFPCLCGVGYHFAFLQYCAASHLRSYCFVSLFFHNVKLKKVLLLWCTVLHSSHLLDPVMKNK